MDSKIFNTIYFGTVNGQDAIEMQDKGIMPLIIYEDKKNNFPQLKGHIILNSPFWSIPDNIAISAYEPHDDDEITMVLVDDEIFKITDVIYTTNGATYTLNNGVIIDLFDEISTELANKGIHNNKTR